MIMTWLLVACSSCCSLAPAIVGACADDSPVPQSAADTAVTTRIDDGSTTTAHRRHRRPRRDDTTDERPQPTPPPTEPAVTTTTEPKIEIPLGVLVAVPTQNREDPAKNQFQVQIHNGTATGTTSTACSSSGPASRRR